LVQRPLPEPDTDAMIAALLLAAALTPTAVPWWSVPYRTRTRTPTCRVVTVVVTATPSLTSTPTITPTPSWPCAVHANDAYFCFDKAWRQVDCPDFILPTCQ
jgi:hypothetical protein